jgi:hypothetical protein
LFLLALLFSPKQGVLIRRHQVTEPVPDESAISS